MQPTRDPRQPLTAEQGATLVALARQTLAAHFGGATADAAPKGVAQQRADPALQVRSGTFVTLKRGNRLRGCIGSLSATASIIDGVKENVLHAAFDDPRFPPLKEKEMADVQIEVSVLSEPEPLDYSDADDLMAKLRPGVDGVIIRRGYASATFLPQVWEQLTTPDAFLDHLCMKAGLAADQWRHGDLTVLVYQVQYFEETR